MSSDRFRRIASVSLVILGGLVVGQVGDTLACDLLCKNSWCHEIPVAGLPCHNVRGGDFTCQIPGAATPDAVYTTQPQDGNNCAEQEAEIDIWECENCDPECATEPAFADTCLTYMCFPLEPDVKQWKCVELGQT